jgi:TetR/AcrR family transcriptional regulator, ethionamide resistance regulator
MSTRAAARGRRSGARTKRAQARERIVAAAERLLREHPYRELTVDQVMAEAGLSRTVFYRHFDGLPELVLSLLESVVAGPAAVLEAAAVPRDLHAALAAAVDAYAAHGPFLRAVDEAASHDETIEAAYRAVVDGFTATLAERMEAAMGSGDIAAGNAYELARALNLMTARYLMETLGRDPGFDRKLALDTLMAVWGPLTSRARHEA